MSKVLQQKGEIMKSLLMGVLVLLSSTAAFAGWGAIAYSPLTGVSAETHTYPNYESAVYAAIETCGSYDCRLIVWEHNSCIAFASNGNGFWAEAHGYSNGSSARFAAESVCGAGCRVRAWACR